MRLLPTIFFFLAIFPLTGHCQKRIDVFFNNDSLYINPDSSVLVPFNAIPTQESVTHFYHQINFSDYKPLVDSLLAFKANHSLNDWFYYQLIRKTAEQISPKNENYSRYTLFKWFLLAKSGYDANIAICNQRLLFYVHCDENIYDIPFYMLNGKQYVCLNKHDYATLNLSTNKLSAISIDIPEAKKAFSYKVTQMPDFTPEDYAEKPISFSYQKKDYHFKVLVNAEIKQIFINYPVVDYESYFNIPLSNQTYSSLIPLLKKSVKNMKQKKGVDYLMQFTRHAFLYEDDRMSYGKEKRMSPEQTLLHEYSDCDDRAALFFYLVKEIYDLPMIVLAYPTHVTIAVKFDKPLNNSIVYKGSKYAICEPTPQYKNLRIGEISSSLHNISYTIAFEYNPALRP